jgi:pilus assembly protein Flp/PilA
MNNLVAKFTPAVEADTDDAGLTTVEYAVAGSLIALATVGAFKLLGAEVKSVIDAITAAI